MKMETDMLCKKEVGVMIGFNVLITIMVNLNIKDFIKTIPLGIYPKSTACYMLMTSSSH